MMNLVDEFFIRNLTEAEAEELDNLLEKSPEEALRLGEQMHQEYLAMGYPEPVIPKHFGPPPSGLPYAKLLLLAAACSTGILTWALWPKPELKTSLPVTRSISNQPVPVNQSVQHETQLPPPPLRIPQRLTGSGDEGNRLSVVVELEQPAPIHVLILDTKNELVRDLYQGVLASGKWTIRWDGLLSNGAQAPGGDYQIRVQSGTTEMTKNVSLETNRSTAVTP